MRSLEPMDRVICLPLAKYTAKACPSCYTSSKTNTDVKLEAVKATATSAPTETSSC